MSELFPLTEGTGALVADAVPSGLIPTLLPLQKINCVLCEVLGFNFMKGSQDQIR